MEIKKQNKDFQNACDFGLRVALFTVGSNTVDNFVKGQTEMISL